MARSQKSVYRCRRYCCYTNYSSILKQLEDIPSSTIMGDKCLKLGGKDLSNGSGRTIISKYGQKNL